MASHQHMVSRAITFSYRKHLFKELANELADLPRPVAELAHKLAAMPPQTFAIIQRVILSLDEELSSSGAK